MKDNPYHLLGDQSLTVVLSKIDFPFPSRGHMVIPKIFEVAVAMSVSKAAMRTMTGHPHARRSTSQQGNTLSQASSTPRLRTLGLLLLLALPLSTKSKSFQHNHDI